MVAPEGAEDWRYSELLVCLPPDWVLDQDQLEDERHYWPIRWLKTLARLPHQYETWLSYGHTVPNGDPPEPYAPNTDFCCMILLPAQTTPEAFDELVISPEKTIRFFAIYPLYREEVDLKLKKGSDALVEGFMKHQVSEIVELGRNNVAKKRFGFF